MKTSTHCKIFWAFKGYILVFRNVDDWECNKYYKTVKHIVVGDKVSQVGGPFIINNQRNSRGPRRACLKHALQPTARCPEQAFLCPVGRRVSWGNPISDYSPCGYLTAFPCDFLFRASCLPSYVSMTSRRPLWSHSRFHFQLISQKQQIRDASNWS